MPRFVLLDHSLADTVGHHYGYARLLLAAAREAGFHPVLAAHRRLGPLGSDFPGVEVHRLFRYTTYCPHTYDARHRRGSPLGRRFTRFARRRRMRALGSACAALMERAPLEPGDVVFAATMSELDFAGLAAWLAAEPRTRQLRWHVQFHVNLFRGREPDYAAQRDVACAVAGVLASALAPLGGHALRLYCTTEALARQYASLGVGTFDTLPYPVDPELTRAREPRAHGAPLRVACLGHGRREKGYAHLPDLVAELDDAYLATGRIRLVVQARRGRVRLRGESIAWVPVGLSAERYLELVRGTDIGLLLYDAGRYYTRCSGVLLELVCAGVPAVVPAGSWLAEQIAEEVQRHLERLAEGAGEPAELRGGAPHLGLSVPQAAGDLLVACDWAGTPEPGTYLRVASRQLDAGGAELRSTVDVLGRRPAGQAVHVLVRLASGARRVELSFSNAYGDSPPPIGRIEVRWIPGGAPSGAVGAIVADPARAGTALVELVEHHEHYRRTAVEFARRSATRHTAGEVLRRLLSAHP